MHQIKSIDVVFSSMNISYIKSHYIEIDINGLCTKKWLYMISLCWKCINVLLDADYDGLNTYPAFIIL
jgi:hypothetical protein